MKNRSSINNSRIHTKNKTYTFEEYKKLNNDYFFSMVIPAYNEEARIAKMLKEHIKYFESYPGFKGKKYEVIIVNDCSKDKTSEIAKSFFTLEGKDVDLKVVEYQQNLGKGGAVRTGMLLSSGQYTLMVDADGATDINCFDKVFKKLQQIEKNGLGIAVGSRSHLDKESVAKRKFYRKILASVSNFIVQVICGVKLNDTQCGFKLFTKKTTEIIFSVQHLERWAFDVEILMVGNHYNMPVAEVPVNWEDVDGSHLNVLEASVTMARDFLMVRLLYLLSVWKYNDSIYQS
ncbi:hypothetical protein ABPG72_012706 [Tetrahymena utriculariae]